MTLALRPFYFNEHGVKGIPWQQTVHVLLRIYSYRTKAQMEAKKIKAKLKKDIRDETADKMFAFPSVLPRCEWNSIWGASNMTPDSLSTAC